MCSKKLLFILGLLVGVSLVSCTNRQRVELSGSQLSCSLPWGGATLINKNCELKTNSAEPSSEMVFDIPAWDTRNQNLYLELKVSQVTSLQGLELRFFDGSNRRMTYNFPIYSDENFNLLQSQEFVVIGIPMSEMVKEGRGGMKVNKASLFLSVLPQSPISIHLKRVFLKKKKFEKGLVSITFDDGFESNHLAAQMAHEMGFQGTAYLIPDAIGSSGYLNAQQVSQMKQWGWDLSSHHELALTDLPAEQVTSLLTKVQETLKSQFQSEGVEHLAYPMGKQNKRTIEALKSKLKSARLAGGGTETLPVGDPLRMKAINVLPNMSPQVLLEKAKAASENGEWAIFMFHTLDQPDKGDLDYSSQNFLQFVQKLKDEGIQVKRISEVL